MESILKVSMTTVECRKGIELKRCGRNIITNIVNRADNSGWKAVVRYIQYIEHGTYIQYMGHGRLWSIPRKWSTFISVYLSQREKYVKVTLLAGCTHTPTFNIQWVHITQSNFKLSYTSRTKPIWLLFTVAELKSTTCREDDVHPSFVYYKPLWIVA